MIVIPLALSLTPRWSPGWVLGGCVQPVDSGAQCGAWLGLVHNQNASWGKTSLGPITKRGDDYQKLC